MATSGERRPLASRQTRWAAALLKGLLATPITANGISVLGMLFAILAGLALAAAPGHPLLYLAAALGVQLRLLCNLMDGLVAVEGGRGSAVGALYNEAPDRLEDSAILIGFGYAALLPEAGYVAAILAVFTAYARMLGASLGLPQDFGGPMAKPQRMAAVTLGCILAALEAWIFGSRWSLQIILAVLVLGTAWTGLARLRRIGAGLRGRGLEHRTEHRMQAVDGDWDAAEEVGDGRASARSSRATTPAPGPHRPEGRRPQAASDFPFDAP